MIQRFVIAQPLERAYARRSSFAVELVDAVTLERVSANIDVKAVGLSAPTINGSGLFVWREQLLDALQRVTIDPGALPYESGAIERADLRLPPDPRPLTSIHLSPRANYPFPSGTTGAHGRLTESIAGDVAPVAGAAIALRWLDEDGAWHDAPVVTRTTAAGDFVTLLRLAPADRPALDQGALTVRARVTRDTRTRLSSDLKLQQGRVADPSTLTTWRLAWDALQP